MTYIPCHSSFKAPVLSENSPLQLSFLWYNDTMKANWQVYDADEDGQVYMHSYAVNDLTAYVLKINSTKFNWFIERTHHDLRGNVYYTAADRGSSSTFEESCKQAEDALDRQVNPQKVQTT